MSHSHDSDAGSSRANQDESNDYFGQNEMAAPSPSYHPQYMTVGNGSQPSHAAALMEQLERDSGYGSMPGDVQQSGGEMRAWQDELLQDRPTPAHTPQIAGQPATISETE